MAIYDRFKDEYIDEEEIDLTSPPERYAEIDTDLIIGNAVRWLIEAMKEVEDE